MIPPLGNFLRSPPTSATDWHHHDQSSAIQTRNAGKESKHSATNAMSGMQLPPLDTCIPRDNTHHCYLGFISLAQLYLASH